MCFFWVLEKTRANGVYYELHNFRFANLQRYLAFPTPLSGAARWHTSCPTLRNTNVFLQCLQVFVTRFFALTLSMYATVCSRAAHFRPPASHFFLRLGLRRMLPQVAPKIFKLILPPYELRIARANRTVKFSGGCLQNCGVVNLQRAFSNPLSTVGNGTSAARMRRPARPTFF